MKRGILLLCVSLFVGAQAHAQAPAQPAPDLSVICGKLDQALHKAQAAKKPSLNNLLKVFKVYRQVPRCDEGSRAQQLSDIVGKTLVRDYARTAAHARRNGDMKRFLFRHVDATVAPEDLKFLKTSAVKKCPDRKAREICAAFAQMAERSLQQIEQDKLAP